MKRKAKILFRLQDAENRYWVLLGRRISSGEEFWWIPGGSVEKGEGDFEAGIRELDEELILQKVFTDTLNAYVHSSIEPSKIEYQSSNADNIIFILPVPAEGFILPAIKDEFEEVRWFRTDQLPSNMSREFDHIRQGFEEKVLTAVSNNL